jgi:murein DD-endopeptidase MepM/ murein hydrolase activator NlpD
MENQNKKHQKHFIKKLTDKYRLVIMDDETFDERLSFELSRFNVLVLLSALVIAFSFFIYSLFIFTPLKEYIPGYGDVNVRKDLIVMKSYADSIEIELSRHEEWMHNIRNILDGVAGESMDSVQLKKTSKDVFYDTIKLERIPMEDVLLREEIEREAGYALMFSEKNTSGINSIFNLNFFPPVKGYVTSVFEPEKEHFGIDIVAQEKTPILSTLDGTVIFSGWTMETGYVIGIQHEFNIVSFYKHNSVILKKSGNFVKAGEPVAIIGNSGELTSGPHLHFELWKDGIPVNPENYLIF